MHNKDLALSGLCVPLYTESKPLDGKFCCFYILKIFRKKYLPFFKRILPFDYKSEKISNIHCFYNKNCEGGSLLFTGVSEKIRYFEPFTAKNVENRIKKFDIFHLF